MCPSKIDHKELQKRLKEDELTLYLREFIDNTRDFFEKYGKATTLTIALVVIISLGLYFWSMKSQNDFVESQILFGNATQLVQQDNHEIALQELNKLIDQYSGTEVTTFARILRAKCYFETGQYNMAVQDYQNALTQLSGVDAIPVRIALVQTYRSMGNTQQALQELETLEAEADSPFLEAQILYLRGGCYEDLDNSEKALETYKSIPRDSSWRDLARQRIDWLEAEAVEPING